MTWPVAVMWSLILAGVISRGPLLLYLTSISAIFGSLTMLPGNLTGNLNVPAQIVCAALLLGKIVLRPNNAAPLGRLAFDVRRLGLFSIFVIYADLTAWIFPRLMAGGVMVYPLNGVSGGLVPLSPTSANFTQMIYLDISIGMLFAMAVASRDPVFRKHFLRSILLTAFFLDISGLIDMGLSAAGRTDLLLPFHNAKYALLIDDQVGTQKRVVGFMSEASAYGAVSCQILSSLIFWMSGFEPKFRKVAAALIVVTAWMVFLSTSATAYVGLVALIITILVRSILRLLLPRRGAARLKAAERGGLRRGKMLVMASLPLLAILLWALTPASLVSQYSNLAGLVLFGKIGSNSYVERTAWTHAALSAFQDSGFIGIGIGSVRSSNWYANILASTGLVGTSLLFAGTALLMVPERTRELIPGFAAGLKLSLIPAAVMMALATTTPDPGVWNMSVLGLIAGLRWHAATAPAALLGRAVGHA